MDKFNFSTTNKDEIRQIALWYSRQGDENNAIKYFLKGIEYGNPLCCIDMTYQVKYSRQGYDYSTESLLAIAPNMFEHYLDLGIDMGSLDCKFYKAREQVIGDGDIDYNFTASKDVFLELKTLGYDPYKFFEDGWSLDEYINLCDKLIDRTKRLCFEDVENLCERSTAYASNKQYDEAIYWALEAIKQGNIDGYLLMHIYSLTYCEYCHYSDESIEALHLDDHFYYANLGIEAGQLDCKLWKARDLMLGSPSVPADLKTAHKLFMELKEAGYEPYDRDFWDNSIDEFIETTEYLMES